jgi:hypothetical protein
MKAKAKAGTYFGTDLEVGMLVSDGILNTFEIVALSPAYTFDASLEEYATFVVDYTRSIATFRNVKNGGSAEWDRPALIDNGAEFTVVGRV